MKGIHSDTAYSIQSNSILCTDPYLSVGKQFMRPGPCLDKVNIIAILVGGSSIYQKQDKERGRTVKDWDGAIVVNAKNDIFQLVNHHRQELCDILGITEEEHPALAVPGRASDLWDAFDAVRFSGYTETGAKKSVKILSAEYFLMKRNAVNILSYKDKRICEAYGYDGSTTYRVHQATRIGDLHILHDQLVFCEESQLCCHGSNISHALFGITGDLLMTGWWILGGELIGPVIQACILRLYSGETGRHANTKSFARHRRHSSEYEEWLAARLKSLNNQIALSRPCQCAPRITPFLYGTSSTVNVESALLSRSPAQRLSLDTVAALDHMVTSCDILSSAFSSNSRSCVLALEPSKPDQKAEKVFCKSSPYATQELDGAAKAEAFYHRIQRPHLSARGTLLYPFFDGVTQAESRMSYLRRGTHDCKFAETVLYAELIKAEATLRAYRKSLDYILSSCSPSADLPIHRFFYHRIVENARLKLFYGKLGVQINGTTTSLEMFLSMPFQINGVAYPALRETIQSVEQIVNPYSRYNAACPVVFGLGDAHGGNILIANCRSKDNSQDTLFIDYEVAGFHPVMLDLAKPFFNDVFFNILYGDKIKNHPEIQYHLRNGVVMVELPMLSDEVTKAVFEIKKRYLIEPLIQMMAEKDKDLDAFVPLLAGALFASAALTRDFSHDWDAFFQNMTVATMLSQVSTFDGLWSCCRALGL